MKLSTTVTAAKKTTTKAGVSKVGSMEIFMRATESKTKQTEEVV